MEWRKSSRSGNAGNCVELRQDLSAVRDSKRPGVSLPVSRDAVRELITKLAR
ncbi:DUF397 domain-containing protein [Actinokineospora spheciospongiae]|uniref:DUF397 domain-containing protein n=1 Tax=Actinokineospora spheciospongiae TaxID=909613 RepID=UPI000D71645E|nr:DUF397 domain-containing protein [Actinokineospora spheciospongiae]PWW65654.1 uncharacterized protein DUF397 [Actinokineospora spheciospongiae]